MELGNWIGSDLIDMRNVNWRDQLWVVGVWIE